MYILIHCIATGKTVKQAEKNMYVAIELHLKGMLEDNIRIPESTAIAEYVVMNG